MFQAYPPHLTLRTSASCPMRQQLSIHRRTCSPGAFLLYKDSPRRSPSSSPPVICNSTENTMKRSLIALLAFFPISSFAALTQEQKVTDFLALTGLFNRGYAPATWKQQAYG